MITLRIWHLKCDKNYITLTHRHTDTQSHRHGEAIRIVAIKCEVAVQRCNAPKHAKLQSTLCPLSGLGPASHGVDVFIVCTALPLPK